MRVNNFSFALALTAMLGVAACSNPSVPNPTDHAERALKDAKLDHVKFDWDKDARVAHLKGTVDSASEKSRAEEVANAAVGTSGRVVNEVTIEGVTDKTADDNDGRIKTDLKRAVNDDPLLRDRDITFEVNNGAVTVKGDVRTAAEKNKVTDIVKAEPGVKDMANALEIKAK